MPPKPELLGKSIQGSRTSPVMGKERRTDSLCLPALLMRVYFSAFSSIPGDLYLCFLSQSHFLIPKDCTMATAFEENLSPELSVHDFKNRSLQRASRIYVIME